jgi:hypothetical protein
MKKLISPILSIGLAVGLLAPLGACKKTIEAPADRNVCFHAVLLKDGKVKFNRVSDSSPNIESCAASLEAMRLGFLRMGGQMTEIMGAYNGQYLFLQKEGVFTSATIDGPRYILLVRTGDGRLAKMGAMPAQ